MSKDEVPKEIKELNAAFKRILEDLGKEGIDKFRTECQEALDIAEANNDPIEWFGILAEFHASYTDQGEFGFGGDWWKAAGENNDN